jgi:Family of unknown function (DUF5343)
MAVPTTYLTTVKNVGAILAAIQRASVPPKFTYDFFKTQLGFSSSSDRPFIPLLRAIGFIDDSGTPLDRYKRFRDPNQAGAALAEGLREGYTDVFAADAQAQELKVEELKGLFMRVTGKSEAVAEKMASTFKALAGHADFAATAPAAPQVREDVEVREERREERAELDRAGLRLHHDVHIHLPISTDIAVYDAIFRSLRANLGE